MKATYFLFFVIFFIFVCVDAQEKKEANIQQLFEKAFYLETVERDLSSAVAVYQNIVSLNPQEKDLLAKIYFQMAGCFDKQGEKSKAKEYYQKIVETFSEPKDIVEKAKAHLNPNSFHTEESQINTILDSNFCSLDFGEAPTNEIFNFLRKNSSIHFVLTYAYRKQAPNISIRISKLKFRSVLNILMKLTNGQFYISEGAVVIGIPEEIKRFQKMAWPDARNLTNTAAAMEQKLHNLKCSIEFEDSPLTDVLRGWSKLCDVNMVVSPKLKDIPVSIALLDMSTLKALRLLCLYQGEMIYFYENEVIMIMPISEYNSQKEESLRQIVFSIEYDIPPSQDYPKCTAYFTDPVTNIVRIMDTDSTRKLALGSYVFRLDQPGYFPVAKSMIIEKSPLPYSINEKLIAMPRAIAFSLFDSQTKEIVPASKIFVNGKPINFTDTFKPGTEINITIEFKNYQTYQEKFVMKPGKGPFVLIPKKPLLRSGDF